MQGTWHLSLLLDSLCSLHHAFACNVVWSWKLVSVRCFACERKFIQGLCFTIAVYCMGSCAIAFCISYRDGSTRNACLVMHTQSQCYLLHCCHLFLKPCRVLLFAGLMLPTLILKRRSTLSAYGYCTCVNVVPVPSTVCISRAEK